MESSQFFILLGICSGLEFSCGVITCDTVPKNSWNHLCFHSILCWRFVVGHILWTERISVTSLAITSVIKIMSVLVTTCWSCFWSKFGIDGKYIVNLNMPHYRSFNMHIICLSAHSLLNCTIHQQFNFTIPSHSLKTNLLLWHFPEYGRRMWTEYISSWIFTFRLWNRKCM